MNPHITKFPNMFAILYGLAYQEEREEIMKSVMLNPAIDPITTPYMRFYELEALCMMGYHTKVLQEIRDYWGGMLREGATSFWEKYVPTENGVQHLAMYGRPYGKSLCHAWGASPVYLLGKGLSQLIVERGELGIGVANVVDHPDQGALHEDEAVGQPSHAVTPRALRQRFVEVALGNAPGLFVEYLQWLNGVAHSLVAEQHEQEEAEANDEPDDDDQFVVTGIDVTLGTDNGDAPLRTLRRLAAGSSSAPSTPFSFRMAF